MQGAVMPLISPSDAAGKNGQAQRCTSSKEGLCGCGFWCFFFPPNCTSWSIKRYDVFLQTSPLTSLGCCGSSPMAVAATPATDSLPAHRQAATPPLCEFCSSPPVTPRWWKIIPVLSLKMVLTPFFFFLIFIYFSWVTVALQCWSSLSALGLCESITGMSHGGYRRGQAGVLGGGWGKEPNPVLGGSNRNF